MVDVVVELVIGSSVVGLEEPEPHKEMFLDCCTVNKLNDLEGNCRLVHEDVDDVSNECDEY